MSNSKVNVFDTFYDCPECVTDEDREVFSKAVEEVAAIYEDENDSNEPYGAGVYLMDDGRAFVIDQWEDYTGHT